MKRKISKSYFMEEVANSVSHGVGLCLAIAGAVILIVRASMQGDAWRVVSFSIYSSSLILLYAASTLYHSFSLERKRYILKILDHSAIYLLIAGTYTPFTLVSIRGAWGWSLFGGIWGLALAGILFKIFFVNKLKTLSIIIYLCMGWLVIIAFKPAIEHIPGSGLILLVIGGIIYSLGVIFYSREKMPFHHLIWHLFVIGGSICHYFAILLYV